MSHSVRAKALFRLGWSIPRLKPRVNSAFHSFLPRLKPKVNSTFHYFLPRLKPRVNSTFHYILPRLKPSVNCIFEFLRSTIYHLSQLSLKHSRRIPIDDDKIVRGHDYGCSIIFSNLYQELHDFIAGLRIKVSCWLISKN